MNLTSVGLNHVQDVRQYDDDIVALLDLFGRQPSAIAEWANATRDDRDRNFGAVHVRLKLKKIEKENGDTPLSRKETYKRFCTYGTHPFPDSFVLVSPNMMTQLGPFPDHGQFKAMVEEIVQHFTFAAIIIGEHIPHNGPTEPHDASWDFLLIMSSVCARITERKIRIRCATTRAQDTGSQVIRIGSALPVHALRNLQHLQFPALFHLPSYAGPVQSRGGRPLGIHDRSSMMRSELAQVAARLRFL